MGTRIFIYNEENKCGYTFKNRRRRKMKLDFPPQPYSKLSSSGEEIILTKAARGNYEKAINVLNRKIAQKPEDYYLYQTKGNVFATAEQYDSAIANYDIVIEMNPKYARTYINEGEIYEILGEKEKAIKKYMVAAYLFARNNFEAEAHEIEKRILKLDPDYKDIKELMHDYGLE